MGSVIRSMLRWFGVLSAGLACAGAGAATSAPFFELRELGAGVWAAISPPEGPAGSNAGFIIGSDGVLVVDTFEDARAARALLAAIRKKTPLPVRYVVNTHYHLDHVAGNGVFRGAGAVVLAHANVRTWERIENRKFFGDGITAQQRREVESLVLPTLVYRNDIELYLGDRKVIVAVLPGHTGGDSIVFVPDADVVFTGDMFWNHCLPNLIDADTVAQIASNGAFAERHPAASFVPGHGAVAKAADVVEFKAYLERLRGLVAAARATAGGDAGVVDAVLPQLKAQYAGWTFFEDFAKSNVEQTALELGGGKRVPLP